MVESQFQFPIAAMLSILDVFDGPGYVSVVLRSLKSHNLTLS